jgi:hypothetical protein
MSRAFHRQLAKFSQAMLELYRETSLGTLGADLTRAMNMLVPSLYCAVNWIDDGLVPHVHWNHGAVSVEQLEADNPTMHPAKTLKR